MRAKEESALGIRENRYNPPIFFFNFPENSWIHLAE
jgi:hypothetical protein